MQPYVASKQWRDGFGANETRITAADLTRMESGISAATQGVTNLEGRVGTLDTSVTQKINTAQNTIMEAAKALVPVGAILPYAGANAPTGWILCNGQLLNRNTYQKLFQVLGTSYGNTQNDNFRVPDLRNRFIAGAGGNYAIGATGGSDAVTLSVQNLPAHTHDIGGKSGTAASDGVGMYTSNLSSGPAWQALSTRETGSQSGLQAKPTGGNQAHENRPPYMAMNYIIKAS